LFPISPVAEATTFAICNGQQMMLKGRKDLNFLPESGQCVLLNNFILISYALFHYHNIA